MGFQLNGLDAIERDLRYPVNWDDTDHFMYNGQKLIYDQGDGYYHTEIESYLRIYFQDGYWIVKSKDGIVRYYGATPNSFIDAVGHSGKARVWALNKVEDAFWNFFTIQYTEDTDNGDYYPSEIMYTQNQYCFLSRTKTIEFSYSARTDHYPEYNPSKVDMDRILESITVKADGNIVREYSFVYETGNETKRQRLTKIKEKGINGSGERELYDFSWQVSSDFGDFERGSVFIPYSAAGLVKSLMGDFDGNGCSDILVVNSEYYSSDEITLHIDTYLSDGNGNSTKYRMSNRYSDDDYNAEKFHTGDFNGDGRADLCYILYKQAQNNNDFILYVKYSNGDGTFTLLDQDIDTQSSEFYLSNCNRIQVHVCELNGDGLPDLYLTNTRNSQYISMISKGNTGFTLDHIQTLGATSEEFICLQGDFNGDGLGDFASIDSNDSGGRTLTYTIKMYKSPGSYVLSAFTKNYSNFNYNEFGNNRISSGDYNGDGLTDFFVTDGVTHGAIEFSKGNGQFHTLIVNDFSFFDLYMSCDFTGNGLADIFVTEYNGGSSSAARLYVNLSEKPDLISIIHNCISGSFAFVFMKPAANFPNAINPDNSIYPIVSNSSPRVLTEQVTYYNAMGLNDSENFLSELYDYENGMTITGTSAIQKSLGFQKVLKTSSDGSSQLALSHMGDTVDEKKAFAGIPEKIRQYGSDGKLYSEQEFEYGLDSQNYTGGSVWFPQLRYSREKNWNGNGTNVLIRKKEYTQYTQESFGEPEKVIDYGEVDQDDADIDPYDRITIINKFIQTDTGRYIVRPERSVAWGYSVFSEEEDPHVFMPFAKTVFVYNSNGFMTEQKDYYDAGNYLLNTYVPDAFGNIRSATENGITTAITYDSGYRCLPAGTTDANGNITYYDYDDYCRLTDTTDIWGNHLLAGYDAYGRTIYQKYASDSLGSTVYNRYDKPHFSGDSYHYQFGRGKTPGKGNFQEYNRKIIHNKDNVRRNEDDDDDDDDYDQSDHGSGGVDEDIPDGVVRGAINDRNRTNNTNNFTIPNFDSPFDMSNMDQSNNSVFNQTYPQFNQSNSQLLKPDPKPAAASSILLLLALLIFI